MYRSLAFVVCCFVKLIHTSKILILPSPFSSHVAEFKAVAKSLYNRGHVLYIVLPQSYPHTEDIIKEGWIKVIHYHKKEKEYYELEVSADLTEAAKFWREAAKMGPIADFRINAEPFMGFCHNPLSDDQLFANLKDLNLDLIILDSFPCSRCLYILPYRLDVPYISLTSYYEPWLFRSPALPSFVPFFLSSFTDDMTFWKRLQNTWTALDWVAWPQMAYTDDDLVVRYAKDKPFKSLNYLAGKSELWLLNLDIVLTSPMPYMPNMVDVGGLTTRPASPIKANIHSLLRVNSKGTIIVSFGSVAESMPMEISLKLFEAFLRFHEYDIIWKSVRKLPRELPNHIKLLDWLPQNDLLGDNRTRLFICHGGNNGQLEAMSHGVPMIVAPLFADQYLNAARIQKRGYGLTVDTLHFSSDDLIYAMDRVLTEKSFKEKITKAAAIFHSRPETPIQRATFWVEYILKFGGDHLRSHALEMPWYQYLMLDILAVLLSLVVIVLTITIYVVVSLCTCRACKGAKAKQH